MNSRITITIILAVVLMCLVMAAAGAITFMGMANTSKWALAENWVQPAPDVPSMKVTNMTGGGKTDLFVQSGSSVLIFDAAGQQVLNKSFPGALATSMGDVDGDGVQEILVYYAQSGLSVAAALKASENGRVVWQTEIEGLGDVGRAAVVGWSGASKVGMVIGDMRGKLVAISENGQELWRYDMQASELRGLDNIFTTESQMVAVADINGNVVALNGSGKEVWKFNVAGGLRRLRTEELMGPGQSAVLLGGELGAFYALDGATGQTLWTAELGQAIAEIRMAELDGDPGTREIVLGGRRNGVWAYTQTGQRIFTGRISGEKSKVTEIASMDVDDSGRDVVAIGDDQGAVTFFDARGNRLFDRAYRAPINRMATGKIGGRQQFIVADAAQVRALTLNKQSAPIWYTPLLGGLLACIVIAIVAFVIASMKPAPALRISAEQMTVEAQKARRIMLHESINDLKRMKAGSELSPEAYLARLKDLRAQLADSEANLIKLGVRLQVETITCPHCGGKLELGMDRCDYCGHTVLT